VNEPIKLSLEQEFHLRSFADGVEKMTREQALEYLIYLYEQMMLKESHYKALLAKVWFGDALSGHADNNTT
jgi:Phycobilisome degradation protein nblA